MVFESMYPILALMLILVACVELCDAATVVDVYRLIQYDISGVPFGSRFSSLNHHAASLSFQRGADLSRSVLILPLRELDIAFVQGLDFVDQLKSDFDLDFFCLDFVTVGRLHLAKAVAWWIVDFASSDVQAWECWWWKFKL